MTQEERHLSSQALFEHWNSGVPVLIPLVGEPTLHLRIDPALGRLMLRTPVPAGTALPANTLSNVEIAARTEDGREILEIATTDERLLLDGYAMFSAIADRIQLDHMEPLQALEETLAKWHSILAARTRMSLQAEIGLYGELLVLEAVLEHRGSEAIESWNGPLQEEHDFSLGDVDLEVKTTSGERRQHWVHGLDQLVATPPSQLWLLSIQITRGGPQAGRTLGHLIDDVASLVEDPAMKTRLSDILAKNAWHEGERDLFSAAWRLRTKPLPLIVDDAFPRLTSGTLVQGGVDTAAIRQVNYEIDVTGRTISNPLDATLEAIVGLMEIEADG